MVQVLLGKTGCTEKVDMYSYGVVLWELCTGESPSGRQLRSVRSAHSSIMFVASVHMSLQQSGQYAWRVGNCGCVLVVGVHVHFTLASQVSVNSISCMVVSGLPFL